MRIILAALLFSIVGIGQVSAQQNVVPISQLPNGGTLLSTDMMHVARCNSFGCDYRVVAGPLATAVAPLSTTLGGTGLSIIGAANTCLTSNGSSLSYQPCNAGGSGTVTNFSFVNGGGASGTVSNPSTTPQLSISPTAGGTFASSANNLGFFASTTSSQLSGVISDETGTGSLVFGSGATLTGITTASALNLSGNLTTNVTGGGAQCLHVNNSGLLSGTGSDCGSGGGGSVSSVFSRTGAVTAQTGDYSFSQISGTASLSTQASGTLQAAQFPALTGDITTTAGSLATTLATVNTNTGSFGSSTSIPSFTVNSKGLITAASGNVVIAPAGTLSGTTLASNVVTSSLTSVGTLGSLTVSGTPTFSGISGSTQCLHVNSSGVVTGTGSDCGSGGGSVSITAADGTITVSPSPITGTGTIAVGILTKANMPKLDQAMDTMFAITNIGAL